MTGITAEWSDGERRWVFPGLSATMGGPKAAKKGQTDQSSTDQTGGQQDDPALASVAKLMQNEKWADAWTEINKLDATKYADNKGYIQMKQLIKNKAGL